MMNANFQSVVRRLVVTPTVKYIVDDRPVPFRFGPSWQENEGVFSMADTHDECSVAQRHFHDLIDKGWEIDAAASEAIERFPSGADALREYIEIAWAPSSSLASAEEAASSGGPKADRHSLMMPRYEVLPRKLGGGAQGQVFEGFDPVLKRRVAIKFLSSAEGTASPEGQVLRFDRERKLLAAIHHSNIAEIYDTGELLHEGTAKPFIAIELVEPPPEISNHSITELCRECMLPITKRIELMLQVLEGVSHAHQRGVIHRDLKPTNLLVTETDGQFVVKIIDFGIAKQKENSPPLTAAGRAIGTPMYMSPEQARGASTQIDERSDLYSLGAVLYELVTGSVPIEYGLNQLSHLKTEMPKLATDRIREAAVEGTAWLGTWCKERSIALSFRPSPDDLPAMLRDLLPLDGVLDRALHYDPKSRYLTATEFAADLQRYLAGKPVLALPRRWRDKAKFFVRRHARGLKMSAALAASLLVGGVAVTGFYWYLITNEMGEALAPYVMDAGGDTLMRTVNSGIELLEQAGELRNAGDDAARQNEWAEAAKSYREIVKLLAPAAKGHPLLLQELAAAHVRLADLRLGVTVSATQDGQLSAGFSVNRPWPKGKEPETNILPGIGVALGRLALGDVVFLEDELHDAEMHLREALAACEAMRSAGDSHSDSAGFEEAFSVNVNRAFLYAKLADIHFHQGKEPHLFERIAQSSQLAKEVLSSTPENYGAKLVLAKNLTLTAYIEAAFHGDFRRSAATCREALAMLAQIEAHPRFSDLHELLADARGSRTVAAARLRGRRIGMPREKQESIEEFQWKTENMYTFFSLRETWSPAEPCWHLALEIMLAAAESVIKRPGYEPGSPTPLVPPSANPEWRSSLEKVFTRRTRKRSNWRKLSNGMSGELVEAILGAPSEKELAEASGDAKGKTTWYYRDEFDVGTVTLSSENRLLEWLPPCKLRD